jgi:hypothetical protein
LRAATGLKYKIKGTEIIKCSLSYLKNQKSPVTSDVKQKMLILKISYVSNAGAILDVTVREETGKVFRHLGPTQYLLWSI